VGTQVVPPAGSVNSAVTQTAALLLRLHMLVEIFTSTGSAAHSKAAKAARGKAANKISVFVVSLISVILRISLPNAMRRHVF